MTAWNEEWASGCLPPKVDLHLHTTASDGLLSPSALIEQVAQTGLRTVAICDHDTINGLDEAYEVVGKYPQLDLIAGVELSTTLGESEVHMVGLFIDHQDPHLLETLAEFRGRREGAIERSVKKLNDLGLMITFERVRELAGGAIGRPHIADALMEAGYIKTRDEAFDKYLGDDGPARSRRSPTTTEEGIALIHASGGVAVAAHPQTISKFFDIVGQLKGEGLDGIEVFAEKYDAEDRKRYLDVARKHDLVPVGGSDYHAKGTPDEILPGGLDRPGPASSVVGELQRRRPSRS
ncbi:MAG: PHP domain-containing protein [Chloroflexi bacterium]|nr:PHP domain-containing protein [Chloroflexota bacterium]